MSSTLISVTNLTKREYTLYFKKEWCDIWTLGGRLVGCAKCRLRGDKLYHLLAEPYVASPPPTPTFTALTLAVDINVLHCHLSHLSYDNIQKLVSSNMLRDNTRIRGREEFCEACAMGKVHRSPFLLSQSSTTRCLELIHTDLCGPLTTSIDGWNYFTLFIDDYSQMKFIYFLKKKDYVFNTFKEFKTMVERDTNLCIKCICSDNGGEYTSPTFSDFLKSEGITHQTTTPYSPEQNGQSEHANCTVIEKI